MMSPGSLSLGRRGAMEVDGTILTPAGFVRGTLFINGERIAAVEGHAVAGPQRGEPILLPGFIDTHVHGGGGRDVMDAGGALADIARTHARHGTTAFLATTMTAPLEEIEAALMAAARHTQQRAAGAAHCLGVHLEGPYISPERLGAQPAFAIEATLQQLLSLNRLAPIRLVTLAPELPGHMALIAPLVDRGFRVQIGHSNGSYEQGREALAQGACGFTHLFNAMSGLHHREPGMVGAALAHATHAELIPDLLHVHPGAVQVALRAIPGLFCVTDATAAAGMPDGEYRLGRHRVHKCLGGVRLADGTLAGSALTMDQALRNLVQIGLPLAEASARTSTFAAQYLGLQDRGRLAAGAMADVVVLDRELNLTQVIVEGEALELAHA
jgi:N-acetylglucosamine-6-phosphate deacetylase